MACFKRRSFRRLGGRGAVAAFIAAAIFGLSHPQAAQAQPSCLQPKPVSPSSVPGQYCGGSAPQLDVRDIRGSHLTSMPSVRPSTARTPQPPSYRTVWMPMRGSAGSLASPTRASTCAKLANVRMAIRRS